MAGYLLYIPGARGADPEHLANVGLAELGTDRLPEFADCLAGPDGQQGLLAFWHVGGQSPPVNTLLYNWRPAPRDKRTGLAAKRFYLGILAGEQILPQDIQRDVLRSGYWVQAADKQRWQIPAAEQLPHQHGLDEEGEFVRLPAAAFRTFWEQSRQYAVQFFKACDQLELLQATLRQAPEETEIEFTIAQTWDFCCQALSINYRLAPSLVSLLGLIDDDTMSAIVKAAIDLPVLLEVKREKKRERVGIPVGLSD